MFEDLFPTPIYHKVISDDEVKNQIDSIINDVKFDCKEEWSQTHYLSTDFSPDSSCNVLDVYKLMELKKYIHKHLLEYLDILSYPTSNLKYETESWFSLFKKGSRSL